MKNTYVSLPFFLLGILFCVCLIAANLFETKQIQLNGLPLTGGLVIFPFSYIINDCIVEVWGYRKMRLLIWIGFTMNAFFVLLGLLVDALPGASYWTNEAGFHAIFGLAPRIVIASFVAFLVGSFANAYVMSVMKCRQQGRHFSLRAILSTIAGESLDSLIFFPLALGGVIPWKAILPLIGTQVVLKSLYEVIALPVTIRVVRRIKKQTGRDQYDKGVSYNIFKIDEI